LQVSDDGDDVAGPLQHRARRRPQRRRHLVGDDVRERGLAEAGRSEEEDVIEDVVTLARRGNRDLQVRLHLVLPDVLAQLLRAKGEIGLKVFLEGLGREEVVGHGGPIVRGPGEVLAGGPGNSELRIANSEFRNGVENFWRWRWQWASWATEVRISNVEFRI